MNCDSVSTGTGTTKISDTDNFGANIGIRTYYGPWGQPIVVNCSIERANLDKVRQIVRDYMDMDVTVDAHCFTINSNRMHDDKKDDEYEESQELLDFIDEFGAKE